jgi:LmbE family N-acetylglucosaminyl deacetylase
LGRAAAVCRWLGLPAAGRLEGSVAVLSPHLDDGVFSLGAAIAAASGKVSVVTVLAGDPQSELPAGDWDAQAGFRTAGEAARARRAEDELACTDVGAMPAWLPFSDHQYPRGAGDDEVWERIEDALGDARTVLIPGFPLMHEDHAWLEALVGACGLPGRRIGRYVEQPYAAAWTSGPGGGEWGAVGATARHRLAKRRACRRYASQLPLLAGDTDLGRVTRYEASRGGEYVLWS